MPRVLKRFVICIDNDGYEASLERQKIYVVLADSGGDKRGHMRVIDESGEDFLYAKSMFLPVDLPLLVRRAVLADA